MLPLTARLSVSTAVDDRDERLETDAAGEPRTVRPLPEVPAAPAPYGLTMPERRRIAWELNPACIECGRVIPSVAEAGLVITREKKYRVACAPDCLVRAWQKQNPTFSPRAARERDAVTPTEE